jgi:phosphocarrier protein
MSVGVRAIVEISQTAANFKSSIVLRINNKHVDVKSILGLSITLLKTDEYRLEIHGPDEAEAKAAMAEVFGKYRLVVEVNE